MVEVVQNQWCGLTWSDWLPLEKKALAARLENRPGLYRIRPEHLEILVYLGQSGRIRGRLAQDLCNGLASVDMPFNDPHTFAPHLWLLKNQDRYQLQVSVAYFDEDSQMRQVWESYCLWQYRLQTGRSMAGNHGRFHPSFTKSGSRQSGSRGRPMPAGQTNPAAGPSTAPLQLVGTPASLDWMGLVWSKPHVLTRENIRMNVPSCPAVYRIMEPICIDTIYESESMDLQDRMLGGHLSKPWAGPGTLFSFVAMPHITQGYQLLELENDLIGGYFEAIGRAPRFQFLNHR